jgi:DNA-binding NarL/FixJ family response regulator
VTRVLLVDDQDLIRGGFRLILERAGLEVVGEAGTGLEAVALATELTPDVILMDIRMPVLDGIEATRRILATETRAHPRVVVLTTFDTDELVHAAIRTGASGFLLKDCTPEALVHAVHAAQAGEVMLAPSLTRRLLERFTARSPVLPPAVANLSDREREVVRLVATGLSNQEISAELFLSEATVKTYVSRLLTKLGVRDRVQIAVLAYETGIVRPGDRPTSSSPHVPPTQTGTGLS